MQPAEGARLKVLSNEKRSEKIVRQLSNKIYCHRNVSKLPDMRFRGNNHGIGLKKKAGGSSLRFRTALPVLGNQVLLQGIIFILD